MIVCFLTWILLSLISLLIFLFFFSLFIKKDEILDIFLENPFVAIFAGLLILANILMIISFIVPLKINSLIGIILVSFIKVVYTLHKEDLERILKVYLSKIHILMISSIITFFSINIPYEDTVDMFIYHIQLSRYFHDYGLVKGIALISAQLGHQSIWFTIPAPLEDILNIYSSLIAGGFSHFLSICQFLQSLFNVKSKKEEVFLASYFLLCLTSLNIIVQPTSVEMVIGFLLGVSVFYCIKTIVKLHDHNELKENKFTSFFWITLLLSTVSLGLKLSALPIFLIGILLFIYTNRLLKFQNLPNQIIRFLVLMIFFALPRTLASIMTSGCPFYPSSFLHIKVPWFVGEDFSKNLTRHISAYAKFGTLDYPEHTSNWFSTWLSSYEGKSVLFFFVLLIFLLLSNLFLIRYKVLELYKSFTPAILPPFLGLIYTFPLAPSARFILPYIIGVVALHVFFISIRNIGTSLFVLILSLSTAEAIYSGIKNTIANFLLLFFIVVYYLINKKCSSITLGLVFLKRFFMNFIYYLTFSLCSFTENPFILSNKSSFIRNFKEVKINSINFFNPISHYTCSYSPLPCYQGKIWFEIPLEEVELIDKEKGVAGGFKRKNYNP